MDITEEILRDKLKSHFTDAKKTTLQSYYYSYRKICNDAFSKAPHEMTQADINATDKILYSLDHFPTASAKVYGNSLLKCVSCLFPETSEEVVGAYRGKFDELCKRCISLREYAKPSAKDKLKMTTFEKIVEKRCELEKALDVSYGDKHIKHIVLCLYTMFPPLRNQDWCGSKLYARASRIKKDNLNTTNYVCLSRKVLVVNDYKTVKSYGTRTHKLPDELIQKLKEFKKISKSKWVVPHPNDKREHMSAKHMSTFLERLCKCSAGFMRKLYISNRMDEGCCAEDRKKLASIMGHSCATQLLCYSRFSKTLHAIEAQ